ncbi:MAG: glycoside hydrolase family 2 TIM barrel-domain containing protein [Rhizobacter sp.]
MRSIHSFNEGWTFHSAFDANLLSQARAGEAVRLPHNAVPVEMSYFDEHSFQKEFGYQRVLAWKPEYEGREVSLVFDGAMANTLVWLNGREVARHPDGYTPFEARLTGLLNHGDNLVTVKIDGSENPGIPPFGGQIDYLTYAGIYREVWLKLTDAVSVKRLKVETSNELSDAKGVKVIATLSNPAGKALSGSALAELCTAEGKVLQQREAPLGGEQLTLSFDSLAGLSLWEPEKPTLYLLRLTVKAAGGSDTLSTRFGFRTAQFTTEGFILNGKPLKIRGLNRHQSYPFSGYAMGRRAQERDADIMKSVLHCNLVRTSHYPQSTHFLDRCDEVGLLVFEEIPGWQHIGGAAWKDESVKNVRRMIERDWNHPSIILWGVRINESPDDHDFYLRTNAEARATDTTRQTGGVRCHEKSEFLEDVYTFNDFHNGLGEKLLAGRPPHALRDTRYVTGLKEEVPYLVTEFNGHMYPTKRQDPEHRQAEHVTRHLQVLDKAYENPHISGAIGWCMFDYHTHNDFGSGDRMCHHGVMDIFREPKFAAYAYASQCDPAQQVVLMPVSYWARGEKDRCEALPMIVLTNCDYIEFKYGDFPPTRIEPDRRLYPNLPHAPVIIDDRHVTAEALGAWGKVWRDAVITGFVDGKAVAEVRLSGNPLPTTLQVQADDAKLAASEKDATRVIVRALDQAGRVLAFFDDVLNVEISGPGKLLSPSQLIFKGGTTGFWIETTGERGTIELRVSTRRLGKQRLTIAAE